MQKKLFYPHFSLDIVVTMDYLVINKTTGGQDEDERE